MREILFRGQTRKKGERVTMGGEPLPRNWVYGGVFPNDDPNGHTIIYNLDTGEKSTVHADTVSQFTGLTAKISGDKIFEGDIIEYSGDGPTLRAIVRFGTRKLGQGFYLEWVGNAADVLREDLPYWAKKQDIRVVGNVWDDPELIQEEGK